MKPEWKKDIKSLDYPNNPLPQFELMGYQEDILQDQKTMKKLMVIFSSILAICAISMAIFFLPDAGSVHGEMIVKKGSKTTKNPFKGKIRLKVLKTRSTQTVDSFFGKTKAKKNFRFVIIKIKIKNNADDTFHISPYALALHTNNGKRYTIHLGFKKLKKYLKISNIKSKKEVTGELLFEIPAKTGLNFLEIKSYSGPIAKHHF